MSLSKLGPSSGLDYEQQSQGDRPMFTVQMLLHMFETPPRIGYRRKASPTVICRRRTQLLSSRNVGCLCNAKEKWRSSPLID